MAKISLKRSSIDSFFEFAAGVSPFDLVDIVNDTELNNGDDFGDAPGEYAYRTHFFVDQRTSELLGADGVRIELFTTNPKTAQVRSSDAIESFEIIFETAGDITQKIGGSNLNDATIAIMPPDSLKRVMVSAAAGPSLSRLVIPGQLQKIEKTFKQVSQEMKLEGVDPAAAAQPGSFFASTPLNAISLDSKNSLPVDKTKEQTLGTNIRTRRSLSELRGANKRNVRSARPNKLIDALSFATKNSKLATASHLDFLPAKREFVRNLSVKKHRVAGAETIYAKISVISAKKKQANFLRQGGRDQARKRAQRAPSESRPA